MPGRVARVRSHGVRLQDAIHTALSARNIGAESTLSLSSLALDPGALSRKATASYERGGRLWVLFFVFFLFKRRPLPPRAR
jgi:hypothetical protein